jgi:Tol biopolymer transport system component
MRRLISVVLLCGCGSVGETKVDGAVVVDGTGSDVQLDGAVPPACNLTAPFGTPAQVAGVNTSAPDVWGWLSPDLLTIHFASSASGTSERNIYAATRTSTTGTFTNAQPIAGGVNTTSFEDRPTLTADGLTMFYESNAPGPQDVYFATRTSVLADFGTGAPVAVINGANSVDWNPFITPDGLTLYFASNRTSNRMQIYRATRANTSSQFGGPTAVAELSSTSDDYGPILSADGLEIFFASYRAGNNNNDIWHATRSTTNDGFGTPTQVTELSGTTSDDYGSWLSPDRCTFIFSSNRAGGNGSWDIWMAKRPQ